MGTIDNYLTKYGKYTFLEKEFNEVDAVIFSLLAYANLLDIVPETKKDKITLKDASDLFYKKYTDKEIKSNVLAVKNANNLLKKLAKTERYKDLKLYDYRYIVTFDTQFGAMCIEMPTKEVYVSYEGTDGYVSGWKEDFMLAYVFPTASQKEAVNYLNHVTGIFGPKVYVGGHSKGGNLALVASMYAKPIVKRKIINVFSHDGPGLRKHEFESKEYKKILPKFKHYVPKSSFVGMLLRHSKDYIVIDSKNKFLMQHDSTSWIIDDNSLKKAELSDFSKKVEKGIITWLNQLNDEKREMFVTGLFGILNKAEIHDLNEIREAKISSMIKILKETKNMDKETRNMILSYLKDFYGILRSNNE